MLKTKKIEHPANNINHIIGSRLKGLRAAHSLTQSELAEILNVTTQQIQKYENGKNRLRIDSAQVIAKALSLELSSLVAFLTEKREIITSGEAKDLEAQRLIDTYNAIEDPKLRNEIIKFIEKLSKQ